MPPFKHPHRKRIDLGGFHAFKVGGPHPLSDLYYRTMEMSWPTFVGLVTLAFIGINVSFGAIYAAFPGAIANAAPYSFTDGFFFSVETLATVGYGNMAPASHLGHSIAAFEILLGLFFTATNTGLIFARFARPRASIVFSKVAVIGLYHGEPALMVRLASIRTRPLADVTAQLSWLQRVDESNGGTYRRLVELPLVHAHLPMLSLSWTLVHLLEPGSELLKALLGSERFILAAMVGGVDTLLAAQSQGSHSYARKDILIDHQFADVVTEVDGVLHLDLRRLHETRALDA
ncbi:MAG TPA: ion channel [Pinirhizobacter sp.]|uniref:ion channel n=1 Tax=Pinirhizobacter sp. TaxID=2950432 RepID=UPI002BA0F756|nr:ion channel [Pinirhizobacter sp.]HMH66448.1 ion channel [Pinirhizobacter sp.]